MTAPDAQQRLERIFREDLKVEPPGVDVDLIEAGVLDSLAFVELLVRVEEAFSRRIALEELDLEDFRSIGRIAAFLARGATRT